MTGEIYLSVVAVGRNDGHGDNAAERTQIFVDSVLDQCAGNELRAELILVEWNPPADAVGLAESLDWSRANEWVDCRVVTVPHEWHVTFDGWAGLPLLQMIGKNVGIRRARGEFVLATNIDVLWSAELSRWLGRRECRKDRLYRCDRLDIDGRIQNGSVEDKLKFAWGNVVRRNVREGIPELREAQRNDASVDEVLDCAKRLGIFEIERSLDQAFLVAAEGIGHDGLHLSMCGDFTLLSAGGWERIGGYAELPGVSAARGLFGGAGCAPGGIPGNVAGASGGLFSHRARRGIGDGKSRPRSVV